MREVGQGQTATLKVRPVRQCAGEDLILRAAYTHPPLGSLSGDKGPNYDEESHHAVVAKVYTEQPLFFASKYTLQTQLLRGAVVSSKPPPGRALQTRQSWGRRHRVGGEADKGQEARGESQMKRLLAPGFRLSRPAGTGTR